MDPQLLLETIMNNPALASAVGSGLTATFTELLARRRAQRREADTLEVGSDAQVPSVASTTESIERLVPLFHAHGMSVEGSISTPGLEMEFHERRRFGNAVDAVGHAAEDLQGKEIPAQETDHDWYSRYFGDVQNVSSAELKELYGKVLSGQIQRPGSVSLLSLNVLKNMDEAAAKLFQTLCSVSVFTMFGGIVVDGRVPSLNGNAADNALSNYGLHFNALNLLHEHGLIIADYNSWRDFQLCIARAGSGQQQEVTVPFQFQGRLWGLTPISDDISVKSKVKVHGVALTRAGIELSAAVDVLPAGSFTRELKGFFEGLHLRMVEIK